MAEARAETEQLRGLNIDQQRALRLNTRGMEQLQVNEKVLKEEVARLRAALDREKVHIDAILVSSRITPVSPRIGNQLEVLSTGVFRVAYQPLAPGSRAVRAPVVLRIGNQLEALRTCMTGCLPASGSFAFWSESACRSADRQPAGSAAHMRLTGCLPVPGSYAS